MSWKLPIAESLGCQPRRLMRLRDHAPRLGSYIKDLKKIREPSLKRRVAAAIERVEQAENLREMEKMGKLKGGDRYYRIKVGDYRIGLTVDGDLVTFVRFLHRKDIYKYFP
jgi:mRNA interferase RelE/StbE